MGGRDNTTRSVLMRRDGSVVMVFDHGLGFSEFKSPPLGGLPNTVKRHVPNAVARRSVGEKLSPRPS